MINEYINVTTQHRVRQYLQGMKLSSIIEKGNCNTSEALEKLRDQINKFAPQGQKNNRNEESKVEYLYDAVVDQTWASSALTNFYSQTPPWRFLINSILF